MKLKQIWERNEKKMGAKFSFKEKTFINDPMVDVGLY